jgi:hypothetical protein
VVPSRNVRVGGGHDGHDGASESQASEAGADA